MKIKQVCEATGLTDRAIRFYIEEGLAAPAYTENYLGRKSFDFSDADVTALNHVATLRKFGFTVEEIRQLQGMPLQSQRILAQVRERKQAAAGEDQEALALLDRLGKLTDYTVPQLVEALGEAAERAKLPPEKYRPDIYEICGTIVKAVLYGALMLAPLGFLLHWLGWFWVYHRYAAFDAVNAVRILLALIPTAVLMAAWLKPWRRCRKWRVWFLCLLYLPFSWGFAKGMLGDSVTMDIRYYRAWDFYVDELDYRTELLFPRELRSGWHAGTTIYEDTDYFYRARVRKGSFGANRSDLGELVDEDHEIYAAWTLPPELLQAEIERVDELFHEWGDTNEGWHVMQKGDYTCWVMDFTLLPHGEHDPFGLRWEGGDAYLLFAFDEETGQVRYGSGLAFSADWPNFPYFRTLDWGTEGGAD